VALFKTWPVYADALARAGIIPMTLYPGLTLSRTAANSLRYSRLL